MARPAGVTLAAALFVLAGAVIGFFAFVMLSGSLGLVQNSGGTTGIFGNSLLGGLGLFFGVIILVVAAVVVFVGVSLWRMQKWARLSAIALLGPCAAFFALALLSSLKHPSPGALLVGAAFTGTAVWMIWYLAQPEVKDAFDSAGPAPFRPPVMGAPRATPPS